MAPRRTSKGWGTSKAGFKALFTCEDLDAETVRYFEANKDYPRDPFKNEGRKRARDAHRLFDKGEGWLPRLEVSEGPLARYNSNYKHFGLPREVAEVKIISPEILEIWKEPISKEFGGATLHWKLEIGRAGLLHPHILTGAWAGLLHLPRGGELVQTGLTLEEIADYEVKPKFAWTPQAIAIYVRTIQVYGQIPNMSGSMNLWQRPKFHQVAIDLASNPSAYVHTLTTPPSFEVLPPASEPLRQPPPLPHGWQLKSVTFYHEMKGEEYRAWVQRKLKEFAEAA